MKAGVFIDYCGLVEIGWMLVGGGNCRSVIAAVMALHSSRIVTAATVSVMTTKSHESYGLHGDSSHGVEEGEG